MTAQGMPPPTSVVGPLAWLRENLFGSILSSISTVIVGVVLVWLALLFGEWALTDARWGVVTANLQLFLIGLYPFEEAWRVWACLMLLSVLTGVSAAQYAGASVRTLANWLAIGQLMLAGLAVLAQLPSVVPLALAASALTVWASLWVGGRMRLPGRWLTIAWLASVVVFFVVLRGLGGPLPLVDMNRWGGLLLTFVLAISGIVLSFPFGVLLALGRRSNLPAIRVLSTVYIEIIRGVPLVTILFMAAIMLPLFLPPGLRVDHVLRAIAGISLFSAAYVAENVRGGLQAIPTGQIEAAQAVGLSTIQTNLYIVLPQALRSVIPANVGLFISLLKDTTLVAIAGTGLLELLGIGRSVLAQSDWLGAAIEVYFFISVVFFVLCYVLSQASYRLESEMGVGKR